MASDQPKTRYAATVVPGLSAQSLDRVAELDLDRLPSDPGEVRVLITAEEAEALVERGFEVVLQRVHRVQPLDPGLVPSDEEARAWLDERTKDLR